MPPSKFARILRKRSFERNVYPNTKRKGRKTTKVQVYKNNLFGRFWVRLAILLSGRKLHDKKIHEKSVSYWIIKRK